MLTAVSFLSLIELKIKCRDVLTVLFCQVSFFDFHQAQEIDIRFINSLKFGIYFVVRYIIYIMYRENAIRPVVRYVKQKDYKEILKEEMSHGK